MAIVQRMRDGLVKRQMASMFSQYEDEKRKKALIDEQKVEVDEELAWAQRNQAEEMEEEAVRVKTEVEITVHFREEEEAH